MSRTLVIVPGSFVASEAYDPVVAPLRAKGYTIHVLDPPSYPKGYAKGKVPPSMHDDADYISDFITKLDGDDVVLMAHSYGGIPASQCLETTNHTTRSMRGHEGGVIRLAFVSAVVPDMGENLVNTIAGGAPPMQPDEDGWLEHTDHKATASTCFNSLPEAEGLKLSKTMFGHHSAPAFFDTLSYGGYHDVPVSWFFCEDDKCVSPEVQQAAIDMIEEQWAGTEREGQKVDVTRVKCDHIPVYSAKQQLMDWMESLFTAQPPPIVCEY